ncbi:MAG: 4Fe-4S binding protein [Anaerolineaceae bacterium]|nr:4Fe-4S binding protein [Anaerolineaceae bacterium]
MDDNTVYQQLAQKLDSFPQGFPPTQSGKELELLALLFTLEEAAFACYLSLETQPLNDVAERAGVPTRDSRLLLKAMGSKGLIKIGRGENGIEVGLLPFVVGFFENQVYRMDKHFADVYEAYYQEAFSSLLSVTPQFHRVIPVNVQIKSDVEILPEDDVVKLIASKKAWAVLDCVCRTEQSLLGKACGHPIKVCLALSDTPGAFGNAPNLEALDMEGALAVLDEAAEAGLVHTISNNKEDLSYVCNCCTCGCSLLRGISEVNIANVVARSAYYAEVDADLCTSCGFCMDYCQFDAISINDYSEVNAVKCVGCGVCAHHCPEEAISLTLRDQDELPVVPKSEQSWLVERAKARGLS